MTIYIKRGTDSGAPSVDTTAGDMIELFDYCLVSTMGWTKEFSGTNKAAYRPPTGNRFYLRVDDSTGLVTNVRGYEAMSDVDTGTGLSPTTAQMANGLVVYKGKSTGSNQILDNWSFFSNGLIFYLFIDGATSGGYYSRRPIIFGDFPSYKSGDAYNTVLIGDTGSYSSAAVPPPNTLNAATSAAIGGHYIARDYTQLGSSTACSKRSDTGGNWSAILGAGSMTYPAPIEGGLLMAPVWLQEGGNGLRGLLPGLWNPLHNSPLVHGDTFSGVGDLSGRTFEVIGLINSGTATNGQCFIETSDTWDTE
jgi:hypothetical protein